MAIEERLEEPTARGLARAITKLLPDGTLKSGDRLPPIRTLATQLCLSATTVNAAWALLTQWGTITTDGRRGTRIAPTPATGSPRYQRALHGGHGLRLDLANGVSDPELLPPLGPALHGLTTMPIGGGYLTNRVLPSLIELFQADWPYPAESFTVVDGAMDAVELILRGTVRHGDRVVIEDPTFPPVSDLLEALGADVHSVPLDAEGIDPAALEAALTEPTRLVFLQPRAQNPTGVSLSPRRAQQLGAIVERFDTMVLEDDASGGISASPTSSLGLVVPSRTIHVRSYSKSHGSDLRLAGVSGSSEVIQRLEGRRQFGQGWTSRILQQILVNLLSDQHAREVVEHARQEYSRRHSLVRNTLMRHGIQVIGQDGLNVWVPVADETVTLMRLAGCGIAVAPGNPFGGDPTTPHVRVSVGMLRRDIVGVAELIARAAAQDGWSPAAS